MNKSYNLSFSVHDVNSKIVCIINRIISIYSTDKNDKTVSPYTQNKQKHYLKTMSYDNITKIMMNILWK